MVDVKDQSATPGGTETRATARLDITESTAALIWLGLTRAAFRKSIVCKYRTVKKNPCDSGKSVAYIGMYNLDNCRSGVLCRESIPGSNWYLLQSSNRTKSSHSWMNKHFSTFLVVYR